MPRRERGRRKSGDWRGHGRQRDPSRGGGRRQRPWRGRRRPPSDSPARACARSRSRSRSRDLRHGRKRPRPRSRPSSDEDSDEARRIHAELLRGGPAASGSSKSSAGGSSSSGGKNTPTRVKPSGAGAGDASAAPGESAETLFDFKEYDNLPVRVRGSGTRGSVAHRETTPITKWEDLSCGLPSLLGKNLRDAKILRPSPIQRYACAYLAAGRDIMASAQTGSGKTLAFLVPTVARALGGGGPPARPFFPGKFARAAPLVLVIAPTRELVQQIERECARLLPNTGLRSAAVFGGDNYVPQVRALQAAPTDVLAGTPGRLHDLFRDDKVTFEFVQTLVLDEADKMLDMGFEKVIRVLVDTLDLPLRDARQTALFSATFPDRIRRLSREFLRADYSRIEVGKAGSTVRRIEQVVKLVDADKRHAELWRDLRRVKGRTVVFVQQRHSADRLCERARTMGFDAELLHGRRAQLERDEALRRFKSGDARVLVATGVAARGLDVAGVTHVVQFDMPSNIEDYTHKIGRTGRAGARGVATLYFDRNRRYGRFAEALVGYLRGARQSIPDWLRPRSGRHRR